MTDNQGNFMYYIGDCRDYLQYVTQVDAVITDPPYNVGKDYGVYKDNLPEDEYIAFISHIVHQCRELSNDRIAFYVGGLLIKKFWDLIPDAHLIVVHKRAIGPMANNYFLQYHGILSTIKPEHKVKDLWDKFRLPGEGYYFTEERYDHPGMTGLALTRMMIETFVPPGGRVLDPFMGVGTTAVACAELGRDFVGIELNERYVDIASSRVEEVRKQIRLAL